MRIAAENGAYHKSLLHCCFGAWNGVNWHWFLLLASTCVESCCVCCWILKPGKVRCLRMKMGYELAEELSAFCMQTSLSTTHPAVWFWEQKKLSTLCFSHLICMVACLGKVLSPPLVPHSQVPRKINHSLFLWVIKIMHAKFWVWVLVCVLRQA